MTSQKLLNASKVQDYQSSYAFINALTGDAENTVVDFRAIHEVQKDIPALPFRGKIADVWQMILSYQAQGYGIFFNVNQMDGSGEYTLNNVSHIRTHCVDLDNMSAPVNYNRASEWQLQPHVAVQTSPNKYHIYWLVEPYVGNEYFTVLQRKLRQLFDGDKTVIDASRVLRLPGSLHLKDPTNPHLVTCWSINQGPRLNFAQLAQSLEHINIVDSMGVRHPLGTEELAAPSIAWVKYALDSTDPNSLERHEWIALTSAIKQSGWSLTDPETLYNMWSEWCARYEGNDVGENKKQWDSIRDTELGWKSLTNRIPAVKAQLMFGEKKNENNSSPVQMPDQSQPPKLDCSGELLTDAEQKTWFSGVTYVLNLGTMFTEDCRFLKQNQFNVKYGGKKFIIDSNGKSTDEPWKAATRSTLWQVPHVDHIRFLPHEEFGKEFEDDLGRTGINTYKPISLVSSEGDCSLFFHHLNMILPDPNDQKILLDYLAHNIKFPGAKIPWAPVIQSTMGAGKGVFKKLMQHCMGTSYTYFPKAKDLADSGSKFNKWMRNKLFILADEIKVDDRRDMIEILKPWITETEIEVQGKGEDQDLEDNYANWGFFSNYKNAVPISKNSRRFAIFYSPIQSSDDLMHRQMTDYYFKNLYDWLNAGGKEHLAHYFLNYPINNGDLPTRAPWTSSTEEAIRASLTPVQQLIYKAIEDSLPGFAGDWVSSVALQKLLKDKQMRRLSERAVAEILESMGYKFIGRSLRPYMQEDHQTRSDLFSSNPHANVSNYGIAQGYE